MCGRFQLYVDIYSIIERYGIKDLSIFFNPKKEIFPSETSPVVVFDGEKRIKILKWGFSPSYAKRLIINARSETVDVKQTFRDSFTKRRCLVPANAFFEWDKRNGKNKKHKIYLKDEKIFSMAGIYNTFKDKNGNRLDAFTILTTEANEKIKTIHNRMPVIIERKHEDLWLDYSIKDIRVLKAILKPYTKDVIIEEPI